MATIIKKSGAVIVNGDRILCGGRDKHFVSIDKITTNNTIKIYGSVVKAESAIDVGCINGRACGATITIEVDDGDD